MFIFSRIHSSTNLRYTGYIIQSNNGNCIMCQQSNTRDLYKLPDVWYTVHF
jgi:hypothetical protein